MPLNIPQSVFDKYYDIIDSTFDIFGSTCQLMSMEKKEVIIRDPDNNLPDINSINDHRRGGGRDRNRGKVTIKEVEVKTDIVLKVYWDSKQWIRIADGIVSPDASVQTVGMMDDLQKILSAKSLIINKGIEMTFERLGGHIPMGIKTNKYFACFWKRIS